MGKWILIIVLFLPFSGQGQTFHPALIGGMNLSQVDGDNLAGYRKFGVNTGAKAYAMINDRFSLSMELLYVQKGSRSSDIRVLPHNSLDMTFHYAEIPVQFHFHDRETVILGLGASYARLLDYKKVSGGVDVTDTIAQPVDNRDFNVVGDFTLLLKKHYGFNIRFQYSIVPVATSPFSRFKDQAVYNNLVAIRFMYHF